MSFMWPATFGRNSPIWMPGTLVAIGLISLVEFSGLGSKVSMWLGPPNMNSRMQLLGLRRRSRPHAPPVGRTIRTRAGCKAPAADSRSSSRRDRAVAEERHGLSVTLLIVSMVEHKLAAIEQHPHQVGVGCRRVLSPAT